MQRELEGQVALVTGGSRGIGRAIAKDLAHRGATVALTYAQNAAAAAAVVAEIAEAGGRAEAHPLDVKDLPAVARTVDDVAARHGRLDVVVANAGIAVDGLIVRTKDEDLEQLFRTNVFGAYASARAAVRAMMRARRGTLVFVGSVVGEMGNPGQTAYAATKAALDGLARSLAREVGSRAITVNVVAPGFIKTDMTERLTETQAKALEAQIPLGRIGAAEEVAAVVGFLASDGARYVTGQVIEVNGGLHM